jgi:hypothetical protein
MRILKTYRILSAARCLAGMAALKENPGLLQLRGRSRVRLSRHVSSPPHLGSAERAQLVATSVNVPTSPRPCRTRPGDKPRLERPPEQRFAATGPETSRSPTILNSIKRFHGNRDDRGDRPGPVGHLDSPQEILVVSVEVTEVTEVTEASVGGDGVDGPDHARSVRPTPG